jgi:hypothetical protein
VAFPLSPHFENDGIFWGVFEGSRGEGNQCRCLLGLFSECGYVSRVCNLAEFQANLDGCEIGVDLVIWLGILFLLVS